MSPPSPQRSLSTRVLLTCAALAAVHVLLHLATVGILTVLAPLSPPLYGLAAGLHSIMPFLARRLTAVPGTAIITAGVASAFISATSPSGAILVIPLLLAGASIDLVVWRSDRDGSTRRSEARFLLAAVTAGLALFAISLFVFSPEHLTPLLVTGTLACRILGELGAAIVSQVIARALRRAGVGSLRRSA
jgi:hypothetical protein